jgi:glyoxylate/hydroxypyruvate reductase A
MRTILIQPDVKGAHKFRDDLAASLPEFHIALSIADVDVFDIEIVIIWLSVPDFLSGLPNLKLLLTCGSGVDHIINSPDLPRNIPLIRLVDPFLQNHVSDYVVEQISKHFFQKKNQEKGKETAHSFFETSQQKKPRIGIMGLGLVGLPTALKLSDMGFEVCGWVRLSKNRLIKDVYVGDAELEDFAKKTTLLYVSCL